MRTINSNGLEARGAAEIEEKQLSKGVKTKCYCHKCKKFQIGIYTLKLKNGSITVNTFDCPVCGIIDMK